MRHLEKLLRKKDIFTFDVTTESCLSIAAILQFAREGYNGVVNVYPFTCMPGMTTSSIVKPVLNRMGMPYLDTPYDAGIQPGRETAIRTFMHQATMHFQRYGRKGGIQAYKRFGSITSRIRRTCTEVGGSVSGTPSVFTSNPVSDIISSQDIPG